MDHICDLQKIEAMKEEFQSTQIEVAFNPCCLKNQISKN